MREVREEGEDEGQHSDLSPYHSDSDSAVMMSGNSPYITKVVREAAKKIKVLKKVPIVIKLNFNAIKEKKKKKLTEDVLYMATPIYTTPPSTSLSKWIIQFSAIIFCQISNV